MSDYSFRFTDETPKPIWRPTPSIPPPSYIQEIPLWILNLLIRGIDEAAQEPFESWRQLGFRCSLALFSAACCNRRGLQSHRISRQTSTLRRASLLPTPSAFSAPHPLKHPFCTHVPKGGGGDFALHGSLQRKRKFAMYSTVFLMALKVPSTKCTFRKDLCHD